MILTEFVKICAEFVIICYHFQLENRATSDIYKTGSSSKFPASYAPIDIGDNQNKQTNPKTKRQVPMLQRQNAFIMKQNGTNELHGEKEFMEPVRKRLIIDSDIYENDEETRFGFPAQPAAGQLKKNKFF